MIKIQNVMTPIKEANLEQTDRIAALLKVDKQIISLIKLYRRSVDARHKTDLCFCDTYCVTLKDLALEKRIVRQNKNATFYTETPYVWKKAKTIPKQRPIIVGAGPAGLFAALTLCRAGIPVLLIEQGQAVDKRIESVENFWNGGKLLTHSNVQFGEGGAGTFSDGKLNTGIKDPRCRTVLETFHEFGANDDILIKAKPHIGTDVLRSVVKNMRKEICRLGGEYLFETEFLRPKLKNKVLNSIVCKNKEGTFELPCEHLILAIGNASRKTYRTLWNNGMEILPKPFAIGVRIEHLQSDIDRSQYGTTSSDILPPAEYKLATHLSNGRGVYTFCMCPGGVVVNSASEENTYVTNGMSYQKRNGTNANSAVLVGVTPEDFNNLAPNTPFGGIALQEQIEKAAYLTTAGKGLPFQTVGSFLRKCSSNIKHVLPTALPNVVEADFDKVLPLLITDSIREALPIFDKKIDGFANENAILTAPETRSSAPVKLLRNELFSSNLKGIYPCGEGAGYAGGITSSAVDGIRTAEALIQNLTK